MILRECTLLAITFATGSRFQPTTTHGISGFHQTMRNSTPTTTIEPETAMCCQRNPTAHMLACSISPSRHPSFRIFSYFLLIFFALLTVISLCAHISKESRNLTRQHHTVSAHSFSDFYLVTPTYPKYFTRFLIVCLILFNK